MNYTVTVATRLPPSTITELDNMVTAGKFKNKSKAIEAMVHLGLQMHQYQQIEKDPEKHAEFLAKIKDMTKANNFQQVIQTMSPSQLDGAAMFIEMEKTRKYQQRDLL